MQHPASARFSLSLLVQGQAQKELFHNEALTLLDFIIQPVVQFIANDPGTLSPDEGQSWVVGLSPNGLWKGKENHIAGWSAGGWRFIAPRQAMEVYLTDNVVKLSFFDDVWQPNTVIAEPSAGATVDAQARQAVDSILIALRSSEIPNS